MEFINVGLKQWKKLVTGSSRPWSDPLKYAEYTSTALKVSTLTFLAGAEITKRSAPAITDPSNNFQVHMRQDRLWDADVVKGVAMITGLTAITIDGYVNGVDLDRARKKAHLNKHKNDIRRGDEGTAGGDADAAINVDDIDVV
ncbi:hypothetical protein [Pseudomonas maumuensis]|uniref:hypothetical protein n=1 Tax=Pseudomonas maumuensis TaxID=2842354 RepID=UPI001CED6436|nr:hypothetical protein [Pseudomonas maumuensis]